METNERWKEGGRKKRKNWKERKKTRIGNERGVSSGN